MNLQQAYAILELSSSASPDEAKKKYKELARKYHPDINKEENSEDKFKKINEAYQCIVNGKGTDREIPQSQNPFHGIHNPFGNHQVVFQAENISLHTTISFKESVLGCQKETKFIRNGKCTDCNGQGESQINNGCDKCGWHGQIVGKQGNMIFTRTCDKCMGRSSSVPCQTCSSKGYVSTQVSININIPGGVTSDNILRLNGMGNYIGNFMGMDQYTEAHLHLSIIPEDGLSIDGSDVISHIEITLLDALRGVSTSVKTIMGNKDIVIPNLTKNKDEIILPNLGVNGDGSQRVIINVSYPENLSNLINVLENHKIYDQNDINHIDLDRS